MTNNFIGYTGRPDRKNPFVDPSADEVVARMNTAREREEALNARLHPLAVEIDAALASLAAAVEAYHAQCLTEIRNFPRHLDGGAKGNFLARAFRNVAAVASSHSAIVKMFGGNLTNPPIALAAMHPISETPTELDRPRGLQDFLRPKV